MAQTQREVDLKTFVTMQEGAINAVKSLIDRTFTEIITNLVTVAQSNEKLKLKIQELENKTEKNEVKESET